METQTAATRTSGVIGFLAGLWLIIAPFALGNSGISTIFWNEIVLGVVMIIMSGVQLMNLESRWPGWLNAVAGLWLVVTPFVLAGYAGINSAILNDVVVGAVLGLAGLFAALTEAPRVSHRVHA